MVRLGLLILSPPQVVLFSGPQNLVTTGGGLKQLEEMRDLLPLVSLFIVKLKQVEEIRDLRHSSGIKNVKISTVNHHEC